MQGLLVVEGRVEDLRGLVEEPLLGDIGVRAEPTNDVPACSANRNRPTQEPPIVSGAPPQGIRALPRQSLDESLREALLDPVRVVRVDEAHRPQCPHLLERRAGVLEPALVVPVRVSLRVRHPCELRDVVSERVKLLFAAA